MVIGELVHNPVNQLSQEFAFDGPTGFADGRQHGPSPVLRTVLVERTHQKTVRCADEIHVAGLPLAIAHLAISKPQLLLPVPMKGLGACPAVPIYQHHANDLPHQSITHQRFARFRIAALLPKQDHPYWMFHLGNPHLFTEVPVPSVAHPYRFFGLPRNLASHRLEGLFLSVIDQLPVELEVPHIRTLGALNVIEYLGTREIAVKREVPWDATGDGIVDQLDTQLGVVLERPLLTRVFFLEPAPFNGIMRSRGTDIVGDQVIMGEDVPLVRMVPEPAHVFDQLAGMVHQRIVDSNHAARAVTRLGIMLQPRQASVVESLDVPRHLIQPTVQTGLVGGDHKLAVDPTDGLLFGNDEPGEVFGEMASFRFVGKHVTKDVHRVLYNGWKVHNGRHQGDLPFRASGFLRPDVCHPLYASQPSLQKFSTNICATARSPVYYAVPGDHGSTPRVGCQVARVRYPAQWPHASGKIRCG